MVVHILPTYRLISSSNSDTSKIKCVASVSHWMETFKLLVLEVPRSEWKRVFWLNSESTNLLVHNSFLLTTLPNQVNLYARFHRENIHTYIECIYNTCICPIYTKNNSYFYTINIKFYCYLQHALQTSI